MLFSCVCCVCSVSSGACVNSCKDFGDHESSKSFSCIVWLRSIGIGFRSIFGIFRGGELSMISCVVSSAGFCVRISFLSKLLATNSGLVCKIGEAVSSIVLSVFSSSEYTVTEEPQFPVFSSAINDTSPGLLKYSF